GPWRRRQRRVPCGRASPPSRPQACEAARLSTTKNCATMKEVGPRVGGRQIIASTTLSPFRNHKHHCSYVNTTVCAVYQTLLRSKKFRRLCTRSMGAVRLEHWNIGESCQFQLVRWVSTAGELSTISLLRDTAGLKLRHPGSIHRTTRGPSRPTPKHFEALATTLATATAADESR
ncbi:unnamed protein product, partial [Ectocarpus sp. 13 AM-2016]